MIKNLKYWLAALLVLSACTVEKPYQEVEPAIPFTSSIEGADTKTYVDGMGEGVRMHWTAQDAVSLWGGAVDGKYVFQGETGDRGGSFEKESAIAGAQTSRFYAVYPYAEANQLVEDGVISVTLPTKQKYVEDSFGLGTAWMTAVTADLNDHHLTFKNAMGFLKLQIYGGATIDNIVLRGNKGEKLSGAATISVAYGSDPVLTVTGDGTTIKLNCSSKVTGAKKSEATAFWFAVPPMTFEEGFTVDVTDTDGNVTTQARSTSFEIERNTITSMAAFEVVKQTPPIPELLELSSALPILYVFTPDAVPVVSKDNWITDSRAILKAADGTITDLGVDAQIKGRGNTTWNMAKKPYALKLGKKTSLLGMPKDKRWDLLANMVDRTRMRNDVALELGRRLGPDHGQNYLDWTPRGQFVELVLNNNHMGNFYLVEHIKIAESRLNMVEMKSTDLEEPAITGGYILECSTEMDEPNHSRIPMLIRTACMAVPAELTSFR